MTFKISVLIVLLLPQITSWELVQDKNNVKVYQNTNSPTKFHEYKAEASIKVSIDSLYAFFLEFDNYHTWIPGCVESKVLLANHDKEYVYYARYDLPWPFQDRDAYSHIQIKKGENGVLYITSKPYTDTEIPANRGIIRVINYKESYELIPGDNTVIFKMNGAYNPGGLIPAWLANKFIKYGPYDVVMGIRRKVE